MSQLTSLPEIAPSSALPLWGRRVLLLAVFLVFVGAAGLSARAGLARLLTDYGRVALHAEPTQAAQRINPADPEAQVVRAIVADEAGDSAAAIAPLQEALAQRPRDYWLWLELGRLRADTGAETAALQATREAVRRAPFYALPRWQLGNMLWRAGHAGEAWPELRRAVASDPALLPAALSLAWQSYRGEARAVTQALPLTTPAEQLVWARFLAQQGQTTAASDVYAGLGATGMAEQRALLARLLQQEQFAAAYPVWVALNGGYTDGGREPLDDGDFENSSELTAEPGFGWQGTPDATGYDYELSDSEPAHGSSALRVTFKGNTEPSVPVLSQLLPVAAGGRYVVSYAVRSEKLLTGGLPVITVRVPGRKEKTVLAQSAAVPPQTDGWQRGEITFTAPTGTAAVLLTVQRQSCSKTPCPCFGQLWLDDFRLRHL